MAAATIPMVWCRNTMRRGCDTHCAACGRKLTGKRLWVEVIDGGQSVAHPGLGPDTSDPGYMGWFAVGTDCARRHFAGFAVVEYWLSTGPAVPGTGG